MSDEQPDLSQPLSSLLPLATKDAHKDIESMPAAVQLTRGELSKEEYVRYLMMLYHVYDALEVALEKHASHPVLNEIYNPTLLARAPRLQADIAYLLDVPESDWKYHPVHLHLRDKDLPGISNYVSRIQELSNGNESTKIKPQPERLLAHAYVRYLGDLSGGQQIRRNIVKAYGLDNNGEGTSFYTFSKLGTHGTDATIGDMRKIKEWFRDGMNKGAGDDKLVKASIMEEASRAFRLNMRLFASLTESHPSKPIMVSVITAESKGNVLASETLPLFSFDGLRNLVTSVFRTPAQ